MTNFVYKSTGYFVKESKQCYNLYHTFRFFGINMKELVASCDSKIKLLAKTFELSITEEIRF